MQNGPLSDQERIALNQKSLHGHFDEVYLVNMPQDLNKRVGALAHLKEHGIAPLLWSATSGYQQPWLEEYRSYQKRNIGNLFHSEFNEVERERGSLFIDSPGVWGYIRTYERILRHALEQKLERVLIFEDDVVLSRHFARRCKAVLDQVGSQWKVLHLGASQYDWSEVTPTHSKKEEQGWYSPAIFQTCGSFAMGLHASIYEELLGYLEKMDSPFDQVPLGLLYQNHPQHCFVAYPNLVIADVTRSTIRHQRHQAEHAQVMRWDMRQFRFPRPRPSVTVVVTDLDRLGVTLGASRLEQAFELHWMHYQDGLLSPIHVDPSENFGHSNSETQGEITPELLRQLSRQTPFMSDPFVVVLGGQRDYSDVTLTEALDDLLVRGSFRLEGARAYAKTEHGYLAIEDQVTTEPVLSDPATLDELTGENSRTPEEQTHQKDSRETSSLVSVIIPTYRRSENLSAAIQSVLAQTYKNVELIVVDDNPAESVERLETQRVLESFAHDSRVVYLQQPKNLGGAAARNRGLFAADGDYICFLDDDDVFLPEKVEASVRELKRLGPEYGGVYCGFLGWNSKEIDPTRYLEGDLTLQILKLDYQSHYLHTCTAMYRKSSLMRINGFDESFLRHQDLELNLRYFEHFKMGVVRQGLVQIRPEPPSNSNFLKGEALYHVKKKYLQKFRSTIENYPESDQRDIYRANWSEVLQQFDNRGRVIEFCRTQQDDSFLRELIPLLSFDSEAVFHSGAYDHALDFTVENIQDIYQQVDQGGPLPSMIRVLPPNLCALLDVRYHHRRGESEAIIGLMRQKSYLCQGLVGAALKDVFSLYVEGIETEACPISDPCMAAHIRQLVLGPTLALPIRRDASLQLERFEDLKDQTSVQVDAGI